MIFVSIDDNEQHHLRMLMDEVFGSTNFVSEIIWQKKYAPANDAEFFSDNHDFILCYVRNRWKKGTGVGWKRNLLPRGDKQNKKYKDDDQDGRGPWRPDNLTAKSYSADYDYPIMNSSTGAEHYPTQGRSWITNPQTMDTWIAEGRVFFGKNGKGRPQLKRYLAEVQQGVVPLTIWLYEEVGHTDSARKLIKEIFQEMDNPFDNPKPVGLLDRILKIATGPEDIILDSFAGSGTTAQAVLALNKEDGGNRKFILVECEDYADTITAERIRRVINGVPGARDKSLQEGLGGSFTYCTLGNPIDVEGMLTGENLPEYSELAAYLLHVSDGISAVAAGLQAQNDDGLFYSSGTTNYHLLYQPSVDRLESNCEMLYEDQARRISSAAREVGKKAIVFGPGKYIGQRELSTMGITFCQLPYEINKAMQ